MCTYREIILRLDFMSLNLFGYDFDQKIRLNLTIRK